MTEKRKLTKSDMEWMNIPPEHWRAVVAEVPESVRDAVIRYASNVVAYVERPVGLLFIGPVGVGKTSAAVVLAKEARASGKTVLYISVWELREDVRNKVNFDEGNTVMDRCRQVDLLVLDGLKPEDATGHFVGAKELEELLATRSSHRRATFITTRCSIADLRSKGFGPMLDALTGTVVPLDVRGPNRRIEQNKELLALFAPDPKGGEPGKGKG